MSKLILNNGQLVLEKWVNKQETFKMLLDGSITLFYNTNILDDSINKLTTENVCIYYFDANNWITLDDFYTNFKTKMNLPDYFGNNLDALNDCLSDFIGQNIAICIRNYDVFMEKFSYESNILPRIILTQCWSSLLQESYILMLIHTKKGNISVKDIPLFTPKWNFMEMLNSNHGQ